MTFGFSDGAEVQCGGPAVAARAGCGLVSMCGDDRILKAARGFAGVGMWQDAVAEIENLPPEMRAATKT